MNTVASFRRGEDAYLFRSFLESEGVTSYVYDEYIPQLMWHYTQAIGGIRVVVADEDLEHAKQLYTAYSEALRREPVEVEQVRGWPVVLLISLLFSMPVMLFGRKLRQRDP